METNTLLESQKTVVLPKEVLPKADKVGAAYVFADLSAIQVDAFDAFKDTMESVIDDGSIEGKEAVDLIVVAYENHQIAVEAVEKESFKKRMDCFAKAVQRERRTTSRRKKN